MSDDLTEDEQLVFRMQKRFKLAALSTRDTPADPLSGAFDSQNP